MALDITYLRYTIHTKFHRLVKYVITRFYCMLILTALKGIIIDPCTNYACINNSIRNKLVMTRKYSVARHLINKYLKRQTKIHVEAKENAMFTESVFSQKVSRLTSVDSRWIAPGGPEVRLLKPSDSCCWASSSCCLTIS